MNNTMNNIGYSPYEYIGDDIDYSVPAIEDTSKLNYINEIKEVLINIIQQKTEIIEFNNENNKNEEIDQILKKIKELLPNIKVLQEELITIEGEYKQEMKKVNENIKKLENMKNFLKSIINEEKNKHIDTIIVSINNLSEEILKNEKVSDLRKKYIDKRKELNPYLYFIQSLNNWDVCNICPLCISNRVDHYFNPCGHTSCKGCIDQSIMNENNENKKCPFCREYILNTKPLFFL